jgi:hypothetical protein
MGHESLEREYSYSFTLSLTSVLDVGGWVVNCTLRPLYHRERDRIPIVQEVVWVPGPVWTAANNLASAGIRSPDIPFRNESLYRLHYPGPQIRSVCRHKTFSSIISLWVVSTWNIKYKSLDIIIKCNLLCGRIQPYVDCTIVFVKMGFDTPRLCLKNS